MEQEVSLVTAFTAGLISFISPCVLPLIPAYLSFISGVSLDQMSGEGDRQRTLRRILVNTLFFVLGFSVIFIALGASATFVGQFLLDRLYIIGKVAGVIIIIFGLHIAGVFQIPFLLYERRFHAQQKPLGLVGSFLIGLAFAFGWTPCIGPILASILIVAGSQESVGRGIILLVSYSLGLGIPFFLTGIFFNRFMEFFGKIKRHFQIVEIFGGKLLVLLGIMIFTDQFQEIAGMTALDAELAIRLLFFALMVVFEIWILFKVERHFIEHSSTGAIPRLVVALFFFDILGKFFADMTGYLAVLFT